MLIVELGLTPETREAWYGLGIRETDQLRRPAVELLDLPGITGSILYETVLKLNEHHLGPPASPNAPCILAPTADDLEMLRLRLVEGDSLVEIAETFRISKERVRQRLRRHFGLSGEPPAAAERRRDGLSMGRDLERMLAFRLRSHARGVSISRLVAGFDRGTAGKETRAALRRMGIKGLLSIDGEHVTPSAALVRAVPNRRRVASGAGGRSERR